MFRKTVAFLKSILLPVMIPAGLFAVLAMTDLLIQQDAIRLINRNGWLELVFTACAWGGLVAAAALLLGRAAKGAILPLFVFWVTVEAVEVFVSRTYNMILDGDWVGIVLCSSWQEVLDFLKPLCGGKGILGLTAFLLALAAGVAALARVRWPRASLAGCVAALVLAAPFATVSGGLKNPRAAFMRLSPWNLMCDTALTCRRYRALADLVHHPDLPSGLAPAFAPEHAPLAVVVFGESATRNRWQVYGCSQPTTPRLAARAEELVLFRDLLAPAYYTADAMRFICTDATLERPDAYRCTLSQIAAQAGYTGLFVSAQGRWGRGDDGEDSQLFSGCAERIWLGEHLKQPWYDDALLPPAERFIRDGRTGPKALFLHMRGSHAPASNQYPPSFAVFKTPDIPPRTSRYYAQENQREHYDNSIAFTDHVLDRLIAALRETKRPAFLLFLSDHGESPSAGSWRVVTDLDVWEIPMFVWMSPEYVAAFPETAAAVRRAADLPLQSDLLLRGLMHLMQIKGFDADDPARDFLSPAFQPRRPRRVANGKAYGKDLDGGERGGRP